MYERQIRNEDYQRRLTFAARGADGGMAGIGLLAFAEYPGPSLEGLMRP